MRTGPSTPVTPCRLSLGDSFPPRRPLVHPRGLAKLVLERGISAQVSTETPPSSPKPTPREPLLRILPSTPPNSPSRSPVPSPVPTESRQQPADNFLASRPAELFLQDVYGLNLGRAPHPDLPSPSQDNPALIRSPRSVKARPHPVNLSLVERLRRLGFTGVLQGAETEALVPRQDSATFVSASGGSLLDGLRRNQSLPAMIGIRAGKPLSNPTPPSHPTSLALPAPPWGNPKERRRHPVSNVPSSSTKHWGEASFYTSSLSFAPSSFLCSAFGLSQDRRISFLWWNFKAQINIKTVFSTTTVSMCLDVCHDFICGDLHLCSSLWILDM